MVQAGLFLPLILFAVVYVGSNISLGCTPRVVSHTPPGEGHRGLARRLHLQTWPASLTAVRVSGAGGPQGTCSPLIVAPATQWWKVRSSCSRGLALDTRGRASSAGMEPPLAEMNAWTTLDEASAWAQVPAPALAIPHAGFWGAGGNGLRAAGAELELDFNGFIGALLDNGQPLARAAQSSL